MTQLWLYSLPEATEPAEPSLRQALDEAIWSLHLPGRTCLTCSEPLNRQVGYIALFLDDRVGFPLSAGVCTECASARARGQIEQSVAQMTVLTFCTGGNA